MEGYLLNYLYEESSDDEDLDSVGDVGTRNEDYLGSFSVFQFKIGIFFNNFRVSRNVAIEIAHRFENSDFYKDDSGQFGKISAHNHVVSYFQVVYNNCKRLYNFQILIFLWYIGHQTASFVDISDRFDITKSSLERIIQRVTIFLSNLSPQVIVWPDNEKKLQIVEQFWAKGFPNIIGAIDGSHIQIDKPQNDPDSYINSKGYYSVQVSSYKIILVN